MLTKCTIKESCSLESLCISHYGRKAGGIKEDHEGSASRRGHSTLRAYFANFDSRCLVRSGQGKEYFSRPNYHIVLHNKNQNNSSTEISIDAEHTAQLPH
jgi:hypothetical protein